MYGPLYWQGCDNDHGGFKKLMWYGIMKEFNCKASSTWSKGVRERETAFTHRQLGEKGKNGRRSWTTSSGLGGSLTRLTSTMRRKERSNGLDGGQKPTSKKNVFQKDVMRSSNLRMMEEEPRSQLTWCCKPEQRCWKTRSRDLVTQLKARYLPMEKIYVVTRCFQERFLGQMEAPSSRKIVKLVFLRKRMRSQMKDTRLVLCFVTKRR